MRVALLQLRLDRTHRAANVQAVGRAIGDAAGSAPVPDVLVVPGVCGTAGDTSPVGWSEAVLQVNAEHLAAKAREWGVFIAAGLQQRIGDTLTPVSVLFDANGDIVATSTPRPDRRAGQNALPAGVVRTPAGNLVVLEASQVRLDAAALTRGAAGDDPQHASCGTLCIVPTSLFGDAGRRAAVEANLAALRGGGSEPAGLDARAGGMAWAVAVPSRSHGVDAEGRKDRAATLGSFVRDRDGRILASAASAGETTVYAEVDLGQAEN